ncbi:MAG: glycosyltransferase family 4 protein [Bacteroidota bacterium]
MANSTWNIYNFRLNLIRHFAQRGLKVVVIAPVDEYIHYLDKIAGITHIPLKSLSRSSTNPLYDLQLAFELMGIYRQVRPDMVIHYTVKPNIFGNLAARMLGIQSICVVTGLGYTMLHNGLIKKLTTQLYRLSFKFASKVLFENSDDQLLFIEKGLARAEKCMTVNGCGVNTKLYRPSSKTHLLNHKVFTFIGRLLYDKGIVEFVEAAQQLRKRCPESIFWVIGEIDERNPSFISKSQLVEWIEDETIRYFGTTKDVRKFIRQSDCIVLPSYREGLSKVILEGLAMGKPIITTDTAGCKQTVDQGKNGFIVPVGNSDALSLAMETFCNLKPDEIEAMGQYSRRVAISRYDDAIVVEQYDQLVQSLLRLESQEREDSRALINLP